MLTVMEISCCPDIIGVDIAPAPGLRASVLYTGIGGGSPASPTIIDFTPYHFQTSRLSQQCQPLFLRYQ